MSVYFQTESKECGGGVVDVMSDVYVVGTAGPNWNGLELIGVLSSDREMFVTADGVGMVGLHVPAFLRRPGYERSEPCNCEACQHGDGH